MNLLLDRLKEATGNPNTSLIEDKNGNYKVIVEVDLVLYDDTKKTMDMFNGLYSVPTEYYQSLCNDLKQLEGKIDELSKYKHYFDLTKEMKNELK